MTVNLVGAIVIRATEQAIVEQLHAAARQGLSPLSLGWLSRCEHAKVLAWAAMSKRGDVERRVNWRLVRLALPEHHKSSIRTLQGYYRRALLEIAGG